MATYPPQFNQRLADQIKRLCADPGTFEACRALQDCYVMRAQIRACEGKGESKP